MSQRKIVGVDLGGSWIRFGVVEVDPVGDLHLQEGDVEERPSPKGWKELCDILKDWHDKRAQSIEGYGIAIAGVIQEHKVVVKAPNLSWLNGCDVPQKLKKDLGLKPEQIIVANDMEAAAYGEKRKAC